MSENQVIRELLIEGKDDWLPVDRVIELSRKSSKLQSGELRQIFTSTIESLLGAGLMAVGCLGETGFEPWEGDVDHLVAKVVRQVEQTGWLPQGGACWFANTELGDSLASTWGEE